MSSLQEDFEAAVLAGAEAARACVPGPMRIRGYEPVADGLCGFAWVTVRPGNSPLARWLKANGHGRPAYGGGVQVWIHEYNQSHARKCAHAEAMARSLRDAGHRAESGERLD